MRREGERLLKNWVGDMTDELPCYRPRAAKRHASTEPPSGPTKMARSIPTGPKAVAMIPGAPTGPRLHSGLRSGLANAYAGPVGAPSGPRASRALHTSAIDDDHDRRNHSSMAAQKSPRSPSSFKFVNRKSSKSKSPSTSANQTDRVDAASITRERSSHSIRKGLTLTLLISGRCARDGTRCRIHHIDQRRHHTPV